MYIFAADLSAAQRRSILGHKNFRDSDWSANNPQPSSEPIGESCTLLDDMLLVRTYWDLVSCEAETEVLTTISSP